MNYEKGANFGDFQTILGLKSQYSYRASSNKQTTQLLACDARVFLSKLYKDVDAFNYITKIALERRKRLKIEAIEKKNLFQEIVEA